MESVVVVLSYGNEKAELLIAEEALLCCEYFQSLLSGRWDAKEGFLVETDDCGGLATGKLFFDMLRLVAQGDEVALAGLDMVLLINLMSMAYKLICNVLIERCAKHIEVLKWQDDEQDMIPAFYTDKKCPDVISRRLTTNPETVSRLIDKVQEAWQRLTERGVGELALKLAADTYPYLKPGSVKIIGSVYRPIPRSELERLVLRLVNVMVHTASEDEHRRADILVEVIDLATQFQEDKSVQLAAVFREKFWKVTGMLPALEQLEIHVKWTMSKLPADDHKFWIHLDKPSLLQVHEAAVKLWQATKWNLGLTQVLKEMDILKVVMLDVPNKMPADTTDETILAHEAILADVLELAYNGAVSLDISQRKDLLLAVLNRYTHKLQMGSWSGRLLEVVHTLLHTFPLEEQVEVLSSFPLHSYPKVDQLLVKRQRTS